MLLGGDELSRTQQGNNNAYCQDNALTWFDWELDAEGEAFLSFVRSALTLRATEPVFRRRSFFQGRPIRGDVKDITWLNADGREMSDQDWSTPWAEAFGMLLAGDEIAETDDHGRPISGDTFLILFNAAGNDVDFSLPPQTAGATLTLELDCAQRDAGPLANDTPYPLTAHSAAVIRVASPSTQTTAGSRTATVTVDGDDSAERQLRNNVADVLRRAEAGEEFTITVAGRPVARLGPAARRQWVSGDSLRAVFRTPAPRNLAEDFAAFPADLTDPFA